VNVKAFSSPHTLGATLTRFGGHSSRPECRCVTATAEIDKARTRERFRPASRAECGTRVRVQAKVHKEFI